jgi:hypothetical protein
MGDAAEDRREAHELPEGDVVRILLEQHARIRDLFDHVKQAEGEHKKDAFDELRQLLAVHETAEEMVVRPATAKAGAKDVADARNAEEQEANEVLAELEKLDVGSADFDQQLAGFEKAVDEHAEAEENDEFPVLLRECSEDERRGMGTKVLSVEKMAPTHPHPSTAGKPAAQWAVGPVASIIDRTRDALSKVTS